MPITVLRPTLLSVYYNLLFDEGQFWRNPSSPTIDVLNLRIGLPEGVTGVDAAAADTDFSIATGWQLQQQTKDARVLIGPGEEWGAGFPLDFPFTIDHGGGTMSPRAFRARTWKVIDDVTYYSPWKYWFAGRQAINISNVRLSLNTVNHIDTRQVGSTDGQIYAQYVAVGGVPTQGFVEDGAILVMQQAFVVGITGGWQTPYRLSVRNVEHIVFSDDEREYEFDLISRIANDASGTTNYLPLAAPYQLQTPGPFPTGDVEFPDVELETGAPCTLVLTVYADDKVTVLWSVGTDLNHAAPYLREPESYGEQEVDMATGAASVGTVSVSVIDPAQIPGDQDGGWMTERLALLGVADVAGHRCRLIRFISEDLGYVVIADGPAGTPHLDSSYAAYTWEIRDTRETERTLRLFDLVGSTATAETGATPAAPTEPGTGYDIDWGTETNP